MEDDTTTKVNFIKSQRHIDIPSDKQLLIVYNCGKFIIFESTKYSGICQIMNIYLYVYKFQSINNLLYIEYCC